MKRFWVRWFGGDNDDPRPLTFPVPIEWWCTGKTMETGPNCTICAIVEAENEEKVWEQVRVYWPEAKESFCNEVDSDWRPDSERFPPKEKD